MKIIILLIFVFRIQTDLLFFQQNSYNNKIHIKWLKKHLKRYFFSIFICLCGIFNVNNLTVYIFLLLAIINLIPRTKPIKPLVWTARIIRLFLLSITLICPLYFLPKQYLLIIYIFIPFILLLTNIIIFPIEKIIRNKYIKNAKKIINNYNDLIVIGITGSYGKTSVKNFLGTILNEKFNVLITPKNYNTTMGIVKTIRENLKSIHQVFICEMGATHKNDINEICQIVKPSIGILTGIAPIHLDTFGNLENLISTKLELTKFVKTLFFNADNKYLKNTLSKDSKHFKNTIGYSLNDVKNIKTTTDGTEFGKYKTSLIGKSNIQNLIGSIKVANYIPFNLNENEIKNALKNIKSVEHRQELKVIDIRTNIIDDAYNSNPIGANAALETLKMFNDDYKIVITPGMIDLGIAQKTANYEFGKKIAKIADEVILIGEKWTTPIKNSFIKNSFSNYKIYDTMSLAIDYAVKLKLNKHKTILIENDLPDKYL